jgi:hypothetical protein
VPAPVARSRTVKAPALPASECQRGSDAPMLCLDTSSPSYLHFFWVFLDTHTPHTSHACTPRFPKSGRCNARAIHCPRLERVKEGRTRRHSDEGRGKESESVEEYSQIRGESGDARQRQSRRRCSAASNALREGERCGREGGVLPGNGAEGRLCIESSRPRLCWLP